MNLDFQNRRALVCGSTQGIGKAAAIALAQHECSITLLARDENVLSEVCNMLPNNGNQKHSYLAVDYRYPEKLSKAVQELIEEQGTIHILVNNTGGPQPGPAATAKEEDFVEAFSNHLLCNHLLMQCCLDGMKQASYGRIINVISTSVKQPLKGLGVSNTIRGAVANWSKTLAGELAQFGITVNNVLPGATNTARLTNIIDDKSKKTGKTFNDIVREMVTEIPAQRFAEPNEIADAIVFLASPAASYINGINLPVDGGRTLSL
ncbi:MAG: SDR family oxidoreductase [Bacteroidetes bacterium]|nr:SDR family oxidoreductase [Bacteroidota bacterium]